MNLGFFSNRRKAPSHSQSPVGKRPAATPEPRCGAVRGGLGGAPPCWHHPNAVVGTGLPLTPCLDFLLEGNLWWKDLHMST